MSIGDEERFDTSAVVVGFALGLIGGAMLALLFTPTRGRDARAWVRERSAAAGRRTAQALRRSDAVAIVRSRGIRGLVEVLRRPQTVPSATTAPQAAEASGD